MWAGSGPAPAFASCSTTRVWPLPRSVSVAVPVMPELLWAASEKDTVAPARAAGAGARVGAAAAGAAVGAAAAGAAVGAAGAAAAVTVTVPNIPLPGAPWYTQ